ncbi:MAG: energy transducer TonB, partial [Burkholderiaceae bacterium]
MNRILVIASSVVVFHIAALWALQSGLLRRVAEVVVPVEILSDLITPPAPKVDLPSPRTPKIPAPQPRQVAPRPAAQPAPQPLAIADQT